MKQTPRERVRKAWKSWAFEIAIALAIFFGISAWNARHAVRGKAPELVATTLDGETVSLASLAKDGPVLVDFWATWCGVCKVEEPNVAAVAKAHRVVAVASQSDDVRAYAKSHGMTMPIVDDKDGELARAWGVSAFPTSFVVDRTGRIRFVEVGYTSRLGLLARLWWAKG